MGAPWVIKKVSVPPTPAPEPVKPEDKAAGPTKPRKKATKAPKK